MIKLTECPRDAMQGLHQFVPTNKKIDYINLLLKVGFDTIDFGSFVSPKIIPQLKDTLQVLEKLDLSTTNSKLLAIVANQRGLHDAVKHDSLTYIGYPFSISETFQKRNTNSNIAGSLSFVMEMVSLCVKHSKTPIIYLSMGFGNPYGDEWNHDIVLHWVAQLVQCGVKIISLADTIGVSTPETISYLFPHLVKNFPAIEFGAHLHSNPASWEEKIEAALNSGCKRFDTALKGYGGCPMATDNLVGNIATEHVISYLENRGIKMNLDMMKFDEALKYSTKIFN